MPPQNPCCRCWLTSLHVIACVTGGFYAIWLLLHREVHETCLAKSSSYNIMTRDTEVVICDVILYASFVAVAWSLLSIVMVTVCNFRKLLIAVQILLSSMLGLLFLALGCVLTIDFVEWCASISTCSGHAICPPSDCLKASEFHDRFPNNTATVDIFWNTAVELVCVWTFSPAVITLALCYVASLWICRPSSPATEQPIWQGHCCGHAHPCPHAQGPTDAPRYTPPPSYSSYHENPAQYSHAAQAARIQFNPDARPVERQVPLFSHDPADRTSRAATSRARQEEEVPLLIDLRDEEPGNEELGATAAAAPLLPNAPLSESGGGASYGRRPAEKLT